MSCDRLIAMEVDTTKATDHYIETQSILLAASNHDLQSLRTLLRTGSASVQDPETRTTPLHAAIASCEGILGSGSPARNAPSEDTVAINGNNEDQYYEKVENGDGGQELAEGGEESGQGRGNFGAVPNVVKDEKIAAATQTVRLLLENGAIWNDVDANDETPGCLARRLGLKELYEIMVDAGVRAEILLNRLDEYEMLRDAEEEDAYENTNETENENVGNHLQATLPSTQEHLSTGTELSAVDEKTRDPVSHPGYNIKPTNAEYLETALTIEPDRILDSAQNGVMMAWETPIMQRTAALLAPEPGLRILNIGHGMGIIDTLFQQTLPTQHHIIEAHPSILTRMKEDKWHERPHVTIHAQKWQDAIPCLIEQGVIFDVIYFDTFAEDYKALRDFFSDYVLGLLDDGGRWGFFNGLGADRQVCYDVYRKVVEMDLFETGFDTEWETVEVPGMEKMEEWQGVRRRYWALSEYRLPICRFLS